MGSRILSETRKLEYQVFPRDFVRSSSNVRHKLAGTRLLRRLSPVWQARAPDFLLLTSFKDFFKRLKNFFKTIRRLVMNETTEKRNFIKTELFRGAGIPGSSFLCLNCNFNFFRKTVIPDFHNR